MAKISLFYQFLAKEPKSKLKNEESKETVGRHGISRMYGDPYEKFPPNLTNPNDGRCQPYEYLANNI